MFERRPRRFITRGLDYHNPLFGNRRVERRRRWPWLVAVLVAAGIIYGIFFSPLFYIRAVAVEGTRDIDAALVRSLTFDYLNRTFVGVDRNTEFLISLRSLTAHLVSELSNEYAIASLVVTRDVPAGLVVTINERHEVMVFESGANRSFFDAEGVVTAAITPDADTRGFPRLVDPVVKRAPTSGTQVVHARTARLVLELNSSWSSILPEVAIDHFALPSIECPPEGDCPFNVHVLESSVVTTEGWSALFTAELPVPTQLDTLATVLREKVGSDRSSLSYIDLRFGERVYYK